MMLSMHIETCSFELIEINVEVGQRLCLFLEN